MVLAYNGDSAFILVFVQEALCCLWYRIIIIMGPHQEHKFSVQTKQKTRKALEDA